MINFHILIIYFSILVHRGFNELIFILQKELQELQKRLVVLGCQLRKAEVGKRTYEVATEKLIHFAEVRKLVFSMYCYTNLICKR